MTVNITELEQRLAVVQDEVEKAEILMTLSNHLFRNRTQDSLEYARQAHVLFSAQGNMWKSARMLMGVGSCQFLLAQYKEALVALDGALALFKQCDDELMCAKVQQYRGGVYLYRGEYFTALRLFQQNLDIFTLPEHRDWVIMARNYISSIYGSIGHYDKALEMYVQTLELARQGEASVYVDRCLYNIAAVYMQMNDFSRAIEYAMAAAHLYTEHEDTRGWALAQRVLGHAYASIGKTEEATAAVIHAENVFRELSAIDQFTDMQVCRGNIAFYEGDDILALRYFKKALTIARRIESTIMIGVSKERMGKIYMYRKRYKIALRHFLAAKEIFEAIGDRQLQYQVYEQLSELYEVAGEVGEALRYRKWYGELKEEVIGFEKQQALAKIHIRKELEAIEREREMYRKRAEQLEQEVIHKTKSLTETSLRLVQKNEAIRHVAQQLQKVADMEHNTGSDIFQPLMGQVEQAASSEEAWQLFEKQFEHLYMDYRAQLLRHCPALSPMELKVCTLLKLNLLSKEIAQILWLSPRTVDRHRYNIRKKLNLPSDTNLLTYLAHLSS